jgi:predicted nucleic acid-binding protein
MVVLDSSFLIAYHNTRDAHHKSAAAAMEKLLSGEWGAALLLEYVFLEVVTVLLARRGIETAGRVATVLLGAREVEFVPCSVLFLEALEVFRTQHKAALSFTDAAIVAVARRREARFIATFDGDFLDLGVATIVPA